MIGNGVRQVSDKFGELCRLARRYAKYRAHVDHASGGQGLALFPRREANAYHYKPAFPKERAQAEEVRRLVDNGSTGLPKVS